jgi:UDP-glucuronate 4-epimerase
MDELEKLSSDIDVIVHLAAKAGVRPSIARAKEYFDTNLGGTVNLLEFAKKRGIRQFVLASSSSVYGENPHRPWREDAEDLFPVSPYAVSKLSAEKAGYAYSYLHGIRILALRLFSVYGPRQRPDLLISKFASLIEAGRPLPVYGTGESKRDFTYVEDVTKIITAAITYNKSNYEVVNVGARRPAAVMDIIKLLSLALKKPYKLSWEPAQAGDVAHTEASTCKLFSIFGPLKHVSLEDGIVAYVEWRQNSA